jgi:hypothetical protein
MKSYNNCILKRNIQLGMWFPEPFHKTILGLSSPEVVYDYLQVLPKHDNLILVNYEPIDEAINANSLVGMFDILLHRNKIPTFIDADFCNSIKNSGDDLVYIYNKCKKLNKNITISFTFSIRGVGLNYTLKWLHERFNVNVNNYIGLPILEEHYGFRQFCIEYGNCIHYRDSGDQMVTGLIKLKYDTKRSNSDSSEV